MLTNRGKMQQVANYILQTCVEIEPVATDYGFTMTTTSVKDVLHILVALTHDASGLSTGPQTRATLWNVHQLR